jgi:triacylglycerol lipase
MRVFLLAALLVAMGAFLPSAPARADFTPGISPPGANDWTCRPTPLHPYPVVLVHGTFGDMTISWNLISPVLKADGYCVFALDYGDRGTGRIEDSAAELSAFIQQVLGATGASRVSIVGHSQGGMMPRYYIKFLGGSSTSMT